MYLKKIFIFLLTFISLTFISTYPSIAQEIFNDDFNDGDVSDWIIPRNNCSTTWTTNNNMYGIVINNACVTETIPNSLIIDANKNYSFELDVLISTSINMDRNFVFKYKDENNWYGLHLLNDNIYTQKVINGSEYSMLNSCIKYNFVAGSTYHFKIDVFEKKYYIYVDGALQTIVTDWSPLLGNYSAGLQASAGGIPNSEVWFDNVKVTLLPDVTTSPSPTPIPTSSPTELPTIIPTLSPTPTATPSSSPTPTPTIAPTTIATPTPLVINVPSLKQYSLPWKDKLYAHTQTTIEQFGCALTSAVMVLQYHGHNIFPDSLNDWLNSQPDGYISSNLINWLAVSRYTKLHDTANSPTLEYKRLSASNSNLDNELNNNRPAILKENGHFIVAKGKQSDTYLINDPGYASRNDLTSYNNSFLAINAYRPTHSDLSYMMFVTDPDVNLSIKTASGSAISLESYIEDPINNLLDPNQKSGDTVRITLFEKPADNDYSLLISGAKGSYKLDSYLYDVSGKVVTNTFYRYLKGNDSDTFKIKYDGKNKIKGKKSEFKFWLKHFFNFFNHRD